MPNLQASDLTLKLGACALESGGMYFVPVDTTSGLDYLRNAAKPPERHSGALFALPQWSIRSHAPAPYRLSKALLHPNIPLSLRPALQEEDMAAQGRITHAER